MKTIFNTALFFFLGLAICYGQDNSLDFSWFRLKGVEFQSDKDAIVKQFGKPRKVVEPDYECGFYSEREQGEKFYQLNYGPIIFIGNDNDKYMIESVVFSPDNIVSLNYGNWKLSGKTTTNDFVKIFGKSALENPIEYSGGEIGTTLFPDKSDVGLTFFFKDGFLVRMEHYSPC